ncbi:PRA1 family protein [Nitzschia inconspicua]|uniref:PRA1 family protein n=1 Tax=Nitzschia inconspicua TaxID=303405 RepID=A0A9K3L2Y1_9STRA|nr:PRA1 family protein [Nitzschia inconspicua]
MSMAAPSNAGVPSGSTLGTLVGVMNSAKEKWDSSGASQAVSNFSASIPDSTKDYISSTTGQLFSRERLRSISVCFGIGEERPFYVEKNPALLVARVKHNLQFFYLNYFLLTAVFFCLTLLISPTAIIGIGLLAASWVYVIKASQSGSLSIAGFAISQTHATIVMGVISAFVLIWLLSGIFWWTLFSSGFMVVIHAGLRDASMHQDGDDQVIMVGEVAGVSDNEQAAFLGDPQV